MVCRSIFRGSLSTPWGAYRLVTLAKSTASSYQWRQSMVLMRREDQVLYFSPEDRICVTMSPCCIVLTLEMLFSRGISFFFALETIFLEMLLQSLWFPSSRSVWPFPWSTLRLIFLLWLLPLSLRRSHSRCLVLVWYLHMALPWHFGPIMLCVSLLSSI